MPAGRFLLIDNGNSFTKLALASEERILSARKLPTRGLTATAFRKALDGWNYERVVLSSVVPKAATMLQKALSRSDVLTVSARLNLGVGLDFPKPHTIGADRLANATGGVAVCGAPVIIVGFGTAVCFDVVSPHGMYVGGVIAPGLEAMTDYLHQRTALLPKITLLEPPAAIGKSTRKAMLSGAVHGYRGLVRQILLEVTRELGVKNVPVVATGGYAELIAAGLPEIALVQPSLTLEGLRIIGRLNP